MPKCPTCPVSGKYCEGMRVQVLCELAQAQNDYRLLLLKLAGEEIGEPDPTPDEVALAESCEHLDKCATGCRMNQCKAGKSPRRSGEVAILDCLRCLRVDTMTAKNGTTSSSGENHDDGS